MLRIRHVLLGAVAALSIAPVARAQSQYEIDFPSVRASFVHGDTRQAAYTLMLAAAHVRQQVGYCRDAAMGERLLAIEARLDALVSRLRSGQGTSVGVLDAAFATTDRTLAEHHVRLAEWGWANQRFSSPAEIGGHLDRATFHFVRSVHEEGNEVDALARRAVDDARNLATVLATATRAPKETGDVIAALRRVIAPTAVASAP